MLGPEPPAAPTPQNTPEARPLPVLNYAQPVSHFPNPIGPYTPRRLEAPNLANTARIDQLMHDGKLYLSLNDAIALALENNLDIAIARYNLNIADTDILRARAGASILGVPSGIVQNTPGGGVGGLGGQVGSGTGGTSLGAGGAGAGAGGLNGSTLGLGSLINSYDPIVTATLQEDHFSQQATSIFQGVLPGSSLAQNTGTVNFGYQQAFPWGTNLQVAFNNTRGTTNSFFSSLSPSLNSGFKATVTQHLLQGFGFAPNARFIRIAKNNRELSDVAFRLQVITTVNQIQSMYWDLVYAYENVRVQKESLAFAQKTLSDTKKQVEIGSLAPIEVGPRSEHRRPGPAGIDHCPHQPAIGAAAHEECAQPHPSRSRAGQRGSDPHFDHGSPARTNQSRPTRRSGQRCNSPSRRIGGVAHSAEQPPNSATKPSATRCCPHSTSSHTTAGRASEARRTQRNLCSNCPRIAGLRLRHQLQTRSSYVTAAP